MDELNKRIVEIMVKFNHSKSSLAGILGVSLPLITHITSGRNKPGIDLLQKVLLTFTEVDPYWLLLGQGEMIRQVEKPVDHAPVLAHLSSLDQLISNGIEVNETLMQYHKILLDEVLHLQEMSLKVQHSTHDLHKLRHELEKVRERIRELDEQVNDQ